MSFRSIKYFIKEGVKSFALNGLMSMASVVTVSLCLVLFGVYLLFSMNLNYAASQVEAGYEIQLYIEETADSDDIQAVKSALMSIENVNSIEFVSKGEALKEWNEKFGGDAEFLEGLEDDNPLRDSFKVSFKDLSLTEETISQIEKIKMVAKVTNNQVVVDKLVGITTNVQKVSFWLMVFFAVISVFIISNTIRITVFARRREVNIMKFVGATDWFISCPFVIEGIIIGFIGALTAMLIVSQAYGYFISEVGLVIEENINIYDLSSVFWVLFGSLIGMGVVLGASGSGVSLRKHLYV
ncbi:MAG: permease-like cell division protein FtsX [Eubacteriales bacterium]|nr:permease-like cell division protein FtsX [Eubacteriales bacterium]